LFEYKKKRKNVIKNEACGKTKRGGKKNSGMPHAGKKQCSGQVEYAEINDKGYAAYKDIAEKFI